MLPLVLMAPLAGMILDFVVPWQGRLPGEEKLEKLLDGTNTFNNTGESWNETTVHPNRFYNNGPYDPYDGGGGSGNSTGVAAALAGILLFVVIGGILVCCSGLIFACQYKSKVTDARPPLQQGQGQLNGGDFRTSPFQCFDDTPTCCHAAFCGMCRAGDTYQAVGAQQYWTVIGLYYLSFIIGNVVSGIVIKKPEERANFAQSIAFLIIAGIFHKYRRQTRVRLGGSDTAQSPFVDFALWWCCSCCVIAQEAREVDAAMGVKVECCCNLQATGAPGATQMQFMPGQPQVTGQPVGVYPGAMQPGQPQMPMQQGLPQVAGQPMPMQPVQPGQPM